MLPSSIPLLLETFISDSRFSSAPQRCGGCRPSSGMPVASKLLAHQDAKRTCCSRRINKLRRNSAMKRGDYGPGNWRNDLCSSRGIQGRSASGRADDCASGENVCSAPHRLMRANLTEPIEVDGKVQGFVSYPKCSDEVHVLSEESIGQ